MVFFSKLLFFPILLFLITGAGMTEIPQMTCSGQLTFEKQVLGGWEIYIADVNTGEQQPITEGYSVSWSPNGSQIAFVSSDDIFVMDANGNNKKNLTNDSAFDSLPTWSPDGTEVAFTSLDRTRGIYTVDVQSGKVRPLSEKGDYSPRWSPDGKHIAFVSHRDQTWQLFVINIKSGNLYKVSDITLDDDTPLLWSPDNKSIIFSADKGEVAGIGIPEIYKISIDGSELRNLTQNKAFDYSPALSPDGQHIVFTSRRDNGYDQLYVMDTDGNNVQKLSSNKEGDYYPTWSPDGEWIAFQSLHNGASDIFLIKPDGSKLHQLTKTGDNFSPMWRPCSNK